MGELNDTLFHSTFSRSMRPVSTEEPPVEFREYFASIPAEDFHGHDCSRGEVGQVYASRRGAYQHVLVKSRDPQVFMVLVLDLPNRVVFGHRLLDLRHDSGLTE